MVPRNLLTLLLGSCICIMTAACSKPSKQGEDPISAGVPLKTARGAVAGPAVTAIIGAGGGQLATADNAIKLIIPAGAITTDQTFSIQPVENMIRPGLTGRPAYRLLPENVQFAKPVTVTMIYNPADLTEGVEDGLRIAYQITNGQWKSTNAALNKSTHTLTAEVTHFSDYVFYESYDIFCNKTEVGGGETADFMVGVQAEHDSRGELYVDYYKIPPSHDRENEINYLELFPPYATEVTGWKIITGGGQLQARQNRNLMMANAKYVAPDNIPNISSAMVEVNLKGLLYIPDLRAPAGKRQLGQLILRKTIKLVPDSYISITVDGTTKVIRDAISVFPGSGLTAISGVDNTGGAGVTIDFGGTTVGGYSCGELQPGNGKATCIYNFKTGSVSTGATSIYCESDGTNTVTKYSSGKVTITRFDNTIVEGEFSGDLYVPEDQGDCKFQTKSIAVRFRIRRQ